MGKVDLFIADDVKLNLPDIVGEETGDFPVGLAKVLSLGATLNNGMILLQLDRVGLKAPPELYWAKVGDSAAEGRLRCNDGDDVSKESSCVGATVGAPTGSSTGAPVSEKLSSVNTSLLSVEHVLAPLDKHLRFLFFSCKS